MKKKKRTGVWKKSVVCALAAALLLTGCGGAAKNAMSSSAREESYEAEYERSSSSAMGGADYVAESEEAYYESGWDDDVEMFAQPPAVNAKSADQGTAGTQDEQAQLDSSSRKIVYTANISMQTLDYDRSSQSIHEKISGCGGFIESEETYNEDPYWYYSDRSGKNRTKRNLNITARIPAGKFDAFLKGLEEDGQVTNTTVNARNISVQYATHDASRKALEIEQKRLLEMMEKAETVEDMILVEERLTQVERELNDEKTQLSAMDRDVGFSTVYIRLQEVFEYTEEVVEVPYGERLVRAAGRAVSNFVEFWEDVTLFIAETFPFLIMIGLLICLARWLAARSRRRRLERKAAAGQTEQAASGGAGKRFFIRKGRAGQDEPAGVPSVQENDGGDGSAAR